MMTIEQILTPEELKRLGEPNEFNTVFNAMHIFGSQNSSFAGQIVLLGDEIGGDYRKSQNRISMHDQDILCGDLPTCRQEYIGNLEFYALTDKRRIVIFHPCAGYDRILPHGYLVRLRHSTTETGFAVRTFENPNNLRVMKELFMRINPVRTDPKAPQPDKTLADQGIEGFLDFSTDRDSWGFLGFSGTQWKLISDMLNAWIPE